MNYNFNIYKFNNIYDIIIITIVLIYLFINKYFIIYNSILIFFNI